MAVAGELARDVYDLHIRLGRWLPTAVVVPAALVRNFLTGLIPPWIFGDNDVAPQWIVVTRRSDGAAVARVYAGRSYGDGEALLAAMDRSLDELPPEDFLETWHATRLPGA